MNLPLRTPHLVNLQPNADAPGRTVARGQNFSIERIKGVSGERYAFGSLTESIILLPGDGAVLSGDRDCALPGRSIVIVPSGKFALEFAGHGEAYVLATDRTDRPAPSDPINAAAYATRDERVRPVAARFSRVTAPGEVRLHPIAEVPIPPDNGRLRFVQSETMSINWVEYDGVRDRKGLSPHAHGDAEQASLALEGDFVHHLRTPWGKDADLWREDEHMPAGPGSVVVIPPEIIHTSEGVGGGRHILIDVFAPPREDFIAKGWVHNAAEYAVTDAR